MELPDYVQSVSFRLAHPDVQLRIVPVNIAHNSVMVLRGVRLVPKAS
jgi:hypothetical protein